MAPRLALFADFIDFDGHVLGIRRTQLIFWAYEGVADLNDLNMMPLDLLDDAKEVHEELLARGRKFERYAGQHHLEYDGVTFKGPHDDDERVSVTGRVMIDCMTYNRLEPSDRFSVAPIDKAGRKEASLRRATAHGTPAGSNGTPTFARLSDEDAMLANATVRRYSFTVNCFLDFFVDKLADIEWNTHCFDEPVLDPDLKQTVLVLVSSHSRKRKRDKTFDGIIKGKGQGLVFVLHGPPGVGKTLTAECVAEFAKRPLFPVSCGDRKPSCPLSSSEAPRLLTGLSFPLVGITSRELDASLTRIMDLAAAWRAIPLIDEADVFLEKRSPSDVIRNAMVSVFLRVLEYYSGILFLTTNYV